MNMLRVGLPHETRVLRLKADCTASVYCSLRMASEGSFLREPLPRPSLCTLITRIWIIRSGFTMAAALSSKAFIAAPLVARRMLATRQVRDRGCGLATDTHQIM
jgi:hypothetical protein